MLATILDLWDQFVFLMNTGGFVMWILFALNLMLWYGLGYRLLALRRGAMGNVRRMIEKHKEQGDAKRYKGILDYAIRDSFIAAKEALAMNESPRYYIEDALSRYRMQMSEYSTVVKTIVMLAPLVGLLGTVIGMIETFDALTSSAMFSQGNSISGGISKALFTTELGLVVAVPGLILGKILDKKEQQFDLEFEQITDIICTKEQHEI